tara:strand:- start:424 stop:999 length:576 start_codon:yes stop_codon:yes gene_type:complete
MKTFQDYLQESEKNILIWSYGRFNPPTVGHGKLIEKVVSLGKKSKADIKIFVSQSQDAKKNPLSFEQKLKFLRKMFPKFKSFFSDDKSFRTPFDVLENIPDQYEKAIMVVGSDRISEFETRMKPYVPKGTEFEVVSAGERDPDTEGVSGISASKMRNFVKKDNFDDFLANSGLHPKLAQRLFDAVKKGMKL